MLMNRLKLASLFHAIMATIFLSILRASYATNEQDFVRPPPGKLVFHPHNRSESDPQQVHISLVGKDHMRVLWITEHGHAKSMVEYGTLPGKYNIVVTGNHTWYQYFFYKSGKIHHATIGPLKSSKTYYYRCGGSGPEFSFQTPPSTFPLEFVVVGDLGQTDWTESTLRHVDNRDYDVFLIPGDLSYADGHQPLWDSFGRLVEPYASRRPWMAGTGNHEVEAIPIIASEAFKAFNSRWLMPHRESGSPSNLYYSFDVAGAHVVVLGSYTDYGVGSEQYRWLQSDLEVVDRGRTPWVFVLVHAPWYSTNLAHQGEGDAMRKAMEELLYAARVDVVFAGHVHAYERFTRIYEEKGESCGPIYVTIGDGGNREGLALTFKSHPSALSIFREASFGHGRLRIENETHAHWSWHRNNDADSVEADHLWLQSLSSNANCWQKKSNDEL